MKVLVILPPGASTALQAVRFWKERLSPNDKLYLLSLWGTRARKIHGIDVHQLIADPSKVRSWHSRIIRSIGRQVSHVRPLWNLIMFDFWHEFQWHVRSFDPDVVDLRWVRGGYSLPSTFGRSNWLNIVNNNDLAGVDAAPGWRQYDASLKVSIVLPVYNGQKYMRQSIDSCLQQTHRNIEVVIVDDCSRDDSSAIIAEYAGHDSRVISIRNRRNMRLPGALNVGFAATTGDLLTWTSHDNYYAPEAIEAMVRYLCTWRSVDLVYSAYRVINPHGEVQGDVDYRLPPWYLPFQNVVGACFLYRRSVYDAVGNYREDMEYVEDYEYWVRVFKKGFVMMPIHDSQYYYRHHDESMTTEAKQMTKTPWAKVRHAHYEAAASSISALNEENQ